MPTIRQSSWTANGVPSGLNLNRDTGIFSGTPTSVGEYTVPVKVTTEYGSDTEAVKFLIKAAGSVLARGGQALDWGDEGVDTPDGLFRILPIPKVSRLDRLTAGFGAKPADGTDYYVCGTYDVDQAIDGERWITAPTPLRLEGEYTEGIGYKGLPIEEMSSGVASFYWSTSTPSFFYNACRCIYTIRRYNNNRVYIKSSKMHRYGSNHDQYSKTVLPSAYKGIALQADVGEGSVAYVQEDGTPQGIRWDTNGSVGELGAVHKLNLPVINNKIYAVYYDRGTTNIFMTPTDDGGVKLVKHGFEIPFTFGKIKDFWYETFILTEDNDLYAKGVSTNGCLGLSPTGGADGGARYSAYTKVGNFDVKKVQQNGSSTFLLTNNGELYHAGLDAQVTGSTPHYEFTRVFENYKFIDFVYTAGTLVAVAEGF